MIIEGDLHTRYQRVAMPSNDATGSRGHQIWLTGIED
jgi:hypothetical protein